MSCEFFFSLRFSNRSMMMLTTIQRVMSAASSNITPKSFHSITLVKVNIPSMMMLTCHSYIIFSRKAVGMYAVTAVNKPSITKPTLCCP